MKFLSLDEATQFLEKYELTDKQVVEAQNYIIKNCNKRLYKKMRIMYN